MAKRSATGVTSGVGTPFRLDGFNGDMTIRTSSQGKKLYVKDFNKWHGINLNIDTLKMKNDVDKLLKDTKKLTINKRRRPLFDSAYFRVGGSATVQLKNVGAVLKVRNLADDADAAINASTGTFMTSIELGHATDTTLERASTGEVNINSNRIYRAGGTDVAVTDGGTGVGSLTDGGILLGSGTSAITATAALGDGEMIVGDGSTDPAIESGTDLRTSIGVGTTDTPTFAEATLSKAYNAIADATSLIITPAITSRSAGSSGQTMNAIKINPTLDADSAAGGTQTFNAVLVNVTETDLTGFDAVNLMDLQIGGTSKLKVNNTGAITSTGTASGSAESTAADTRYLMMNASTGLVGFRTAGEIKSDSALATVDGSFSSLNVTSTTAPQATIAYQADEHLTVSVANNGVTTLATSDNAGTTLANLTLDVDGDIKLEPASGGVKVAEASEAAADTAAYGQLWVKNSDPNELCFTDDDGTDVVGIGKYHYESKICNYYTTVVANFIPLVGYTVERTSLAGNNEFIAMVAPYNGVIEKILWRSEVAQDGTLQMDIHESGTGDEIPGLSPIGTKDTVIDIADDTTQDVSFASMTSGRSLLVKGNIYAIKITSPSASNDTNVTVVFKWDITE